MPTVEIGDRRLSYIDEGVGDTALVLVHDFPLHAAMWRPQCDAFAGDFRVIAPDLSGCGSSDVLTPPEATTIDTWADDVVVLIEELGLHPATLVGTGVGADVVLAVARRDRDAVGALGLLAPLARATAMQDALHWGHQRDWIAKGGELDSVIERLVTIVSSDDAPAHSEAVKLVRWMIRATSRAGWIAGMGALETRPDPLADIAKLDVPVIVVAGAADAVSPPDDVAAMAERIAGAGCVVTERSGHVPNLDNPAVVNHALEELLVGRSTRRTNARHAWPASPAMTRTR